MPATMTGRQVLGVRVVVVAHIPVVVVVAPAVLARPPAHLEEVSRVTHTQFQDLVLPGRATTEEQVARTIPMALVGPVVLEFILHWRAILLPAEAEEPPGIPELPIKEAAEPQEEAPEGEVQITLPPPQVQQITAVVEVELMETQVQEVEVALE